MKSKIWFIALVLVSQQVSAQGEFVNRSDKRPSLNAERNASSNSNLNPFDKEKIFYVETRELKYNDLPKVDVKIIRTQKLNTIIPADAVLPSSFEPIVKMGYEKKQALAYILIPHYIKNSLGELEELLDYDVKYEESGSSYKVTGNRSYALNSVLSNGDFYKIGISQQGVYKIDYNFIASKLNVDPASINTANIRLYGNGGQMLPESNTIIPIDDVMENAIFVSDGGDGKFDIGDYILFYAPGPHTILSDSIQQVFSHRFNIYSESSYYFLNFNVGVGKRIDLHPIVAAANKVVNSFNEFQFYERDSVNLGRFGKEFWGDEMSNLPGRTLNKMLTFNLPDIDPSTPLVLSTRTGSITHTSASTLKVLVNGSQKQNIIYEAFGDNYYDPVIQIKEEKSQITNPSALVNVTMQFQPPSNDASAYIGHVTLNARRSLNLSGYLNFADFGSLGSNHISEYNISNTSNNSLVWDVTNPLLPMRMQTVQNGNLLQFNQNASSLHRFVAFETSGLPIPSFVERIPNQNLHALKNIDYIVITTDALKQEAERLVNHHTAKRSYSSIIVTPQEIYNEFSSGGQDIAAIRNFIKMLYDKSDMAHLPNSVLLFGDASYDYKNRLKNNTNLVPTHETAQSNNKILGYCSDDFYGFLDDAENLNDYAGNIINTLDIGVGRIPVSTLSQAAGVVNKIINYDGANSFGPWKNSVTFCADNGDGARHLDDGEVMYNVLNDSLPAFNAQKIYVDGFQLQSTPAGQRAPDANKAVLANLFNGTFLMNYNGHGGPGGWCEERIFSFNDINNIKNFSKLPLFITATCDFAPFDNPGYVSAGETLVNKPDGGAIALMTTTQLVFADQNRIMNENYMKRGFSKKSATEYPTLGDAYRFSKNLRYNNYVDESTAANFRKFALLGDPGLPLAIPQYKVFTDSINSVAVSVQYDTLKALGKYTISGHVTDANGTPLPNFNGVVYPTIFDKPKKLTTLQSIGDPKREYYVQNNAVYKGKASVKNGSFRFTFVMPKDINYDIAKGKISYYVNNDVMDGNGFDRNIFIGGNSGTGVSDNVGPVIKAYMNDEKFVNGGITPSESKLILKLFDENGINYSGNSIGHDITAVLDNNPQNSYVLNNFFEADLDDYLSGVVRFPLSYLSEGEHTITIRAWDVANNSSEVSLRFVVVNGNEGKLAHVLNYPNPFSTYTQFMFEHNMPNQNLHVNLQVLSVSGKVVKSFRTMLNTEGTRICAIDWDGKDEYGDLLANGVYLYKLNVKSSSGLSDTKLEKLIILR